MNQSECKGIELHCNRSKNTCVKWNNNMAMFSGWTGNITQFVCADKKRVMFLKGKLVFEWLTHEDVSIKCISFRSSTLFHNMPFFCSVKDTFVSFTLRVNDVQAFFSWNDIYMSIQSTLIFFLTRLNIVSLVCTQSILPAQN